MAELSAVYIVSAREHRSEPSWALSLRCPRRGSGPSPSARPSNGPSSLRSSSAKFSLETCFRGPLDRRRPTGFDLCRHSHSVPTTPQQGVGSGLQAVVLGAKTIAWETPTSWSLRHGIDVELPYYLPESAYGLPHGRRGHRRRDDVRRPFDPYHKIPWASGGALRRRVPSHPRLRRTRSRRKLQESDARAE